MSNIEKMEIDAFNEAMGCVDLTKEELLAECKDMQKQIDLHRQQYIKLEDRYNSEREQWRKYRRDLMAENDTLRDQVLLLDNKLKMLDVVKAKERSRLVATVPKLVIIAGVALVLCVVPNLLQRFGVIGPQTSYALQCGLMMTISWCYSLIFDRTKK